MFLDYSVATLIVAASVVLLGSCLQSASGSGLALLATPVFALLDTRLVPVPVVVSGLVLQILMSIRERRSVDLGGVKWSVVGYVPGAIIGGLTLTVLSETALALVCAATILIAVFVSLLGRNLSINVCTLLGAGAASGFMGTASGVSGPPMALLYQHASGARLRATVSGFFVIGNILTLFVLGVLGALDIRSLIISLVLLPGVAMGYILGGKLRQLVDRGILRPLVLLTSTAAAVVLVVKTVPDM